MSVRAETIIESEMEAIRHAAVAAGRPLSEHERDRLDDLIVERAASQ